MKKVVGSANDKNPLVFVIVIAIHRGVVAA